MLHWNHMDKIQVRINLILVTTIYTNEKIMKKEIPQHKIYE